MLDHIRQLIPHGDEKALHQAFYTTAAMLFVLAACTIALYVYLVLEIFMKPLMWAILSGSILFPLKYSLYLTIKSWMVDQEANNRLLIVASLLLPMHILYKVSDCVGAYFTSRWKTCCVAMMVYLAMNFIRLTLDQLVTVIYYICFHVWIKMELVVEFFTPYQTVFATFFIVYIVTIIVCELSPDSWIKYLGIPAWLSFVMFITCVACSLQIPSGILSILFLMLFVAIVKQKINDAGKYAIQLFVTITHADVSDNSSQNDTDTCNASGLSDSQPAESNENLKSSSHYINLLIDIICVAAVCSHSWIRLLLLFLLIFWGFRQLIAHDAVGNIVNRVCSICFNTDFKNVKIVLENRYKQRETLLYPPPVNAAYSIISQMDGKIRGAVLGRLPTLTSVAIILSIILGSVSVLIFFVIHIQQEGFLLIQMTAALINETAIKHPEYKSWLPESDLVLESVDAVVEKMYWHGKDWLKETLNENVNGDVNTTLIETQVLVLWDRVYHLWLNRTLVDGKNLQEYRKVDGSVTNSSYANLFSPLMALEMTDIANLFKHDMSALKSILESFFFILQSNIKLVISLVQAVFMMIFYGGNAVLNFSVSVIVYLTAIFYLLAGSDDEYMPFRLVSTASSSELWASPILKSIQHAVSGVFGALFKMASFYGLYTWVNHALMGSTFIYVPSLLAIIFSIMPALPTYCCCFPAILELWILQGSLFRGFSLLVLQFLPTLIVDVTIYQEMVESGSGHPYITSLSVVGGLYYFGLEGAIIGPIFLCVLLVVVNAYFNIIGKPISVATSHTMTDHDKDKSD